MATNEQFHLIGSDELAAILGGKGGSGGRFSDEFLRELGIDPATQGCLPNDCNKLPVFKVPRDKLGRPLGPPVEVLKRGS